MRRLLALLGLTLLLGGCSGMRLVESQVQATATPGAEAAIAPGARYRFERLPSQAEQAHTDTVEAIAEAELAEVGLRGHRHRLRRAGRHRTGAPRRRHGPRAGHTDMTTPVACSLRVAASHPQGGNASGPAKPVPRHSAVYGPAAPSVVLPGRGL